MPLIISFVNGNRQFRSFSDQATDNVSVDASTKLTRSSFDNTNYQCKEYYSYNEFSYYDIDSMCISKRLPQPTAEFKDPNEAK